MTNQEPTKNQRRTVVVSSRSCPVLLIRLVGENAGLPEHSALVLMPCHPSGLNNLETHKQTGKEGDGGRVSGRREALLHCYWLGYSAPCSRPSTFMAAVLTPGWRKRFDLVAL